MPYHLRMTILWHWRTAPGNATWYCFLGRETLTLPGSLPEARGEMCAWKAWVPQVGSRRRPKALGPEATMEFMALLVMEIQSSVCTSSDGHPCWAHPRYQAESCVQALNTQLWSRSTRFSNMALACTGAELPHKGVLSTLPRMLHGSSWGSS